MSIIPLEFGNDMFPLATHAYIPVYVFAIVYNMHQLYVCIFVSKDYTRRFSYLLYIDWYPGSINQSQSDLSSLWESVHTRLDWSQFALRKCSHLFRSISVRIQALTFTFRSLVTSIDTLHWRQNGHLGGQLQSFAVQYCKSQKSYFKKIILVILSRLQDNNLTKTR